MKLLKVERYGKDKQLASISKAGIHEDRFGECKAHIDLGNGSNSFRLEMSLKEANDLIKQLRREIESSANSGQNGRINNWYSLDEINPDLK